MSDLFDVSADDLDRKAPPLQRVVDWFHGRASTARRQDLHHRLGYGPGDAAPGEDVRAFLLGQKVPGFSEQTGALRVEIPSLTVGVEGNEIRLVVDRSGFVNMEGSVENGNGLTLSSTAQTIFTIADTKLRPKAARSGLVPGNGATGLLRWTMNTNGAFQLQVHAASTATPTLAHLDSVRWLGQS